MTLESTQTTTFAVNLKTMSTDKRQLILGLPHFVSYLIEGADGAIDHWESALIMDAFGVHTDPDMPNSAFFR